jgi:hypothetical protein
MKVYRLMILVLAMVVAGCASHGPSKAERALSECKSVCVGAADPFDQIYLPQVARSLEALGFNIVEDAGQRDTLVCKAASSQEGTFDWSFQISLWRDGKKVALAEARNEDIGSLGQPQAAKYKVVEAAFEKLEARLRELQKSGSAAPKG